MAYDVENRMVTATNGGGGSSSGHLLVVWNTDEPLADKKLKWLVTDHLGSSRMEADKSGSLAGITRHDYAPFGEELYAGIRQSGGVGQYGYEPPQSTLRIRFDAYERDSETGLDFAKARYFSSLQGRFASTDPLYYQVYMAIDPQRFNLYAFTRNNPLKWTDPDGLRLVLRGNSNWLIEHVLDPLTGGLFNEFFYIENGEVFVRYDRIEAATHQGPLNAGIALVL
jgi:RHS repeat-associated protein